MMVYSPFRHHVAFGKEDEKEEKKACDDDADDETRESAE